jgi:hypothetical protein
MGEYLQINVGMMEENVGMMEENVGRREGEEIEVCGVV